MVKTLACIGIYFGFLVVLAVGIATFFAVTVGTIMALQYIFGEYLAPVALGLGGLVFVWFLVGKEVSEDIYKEITKWLDKRKARAV